MSLRLPTMTFNAVFDLGERRAQPLPLPAGLGRPELFGDWDDDDETGALYVGFGTGQLHLETTPNGVDFHFHAADGSDTDESPWSPSDTRMLVDWASALLIEFGALAPEILDDIDDAASWHDEGYSLYVCEVEGPTKLELITVDIEGELLTLPWLGAGRVEHEHIDGDGHPIALMWTSGEGDPDLAIAEARLEPATEKPVTNAVAGIDWTAVGMPADEVLSWLEGIYLNHHVLPDAAGSILSAVLERLGGIDTDAFAG